jgi:hypothetical protein
MTDTRQVLGLLRSLLISGADIHQHMSTLLLRKFRGLECSRTQVESYALHDNEWEVLYL